MQQNQTSLNKTDSSPIRLESGITINKSKFDHFFKKNQSTRQKITNQTTLLDQRQNSGLNVNKSRMVLKNSQSVLRTKSQIVIAIESELKNLIKDVHRIIPVTVLTMSDKSLTKEQYYKKYHSYLLKVQSNQRKVQALKLKKKLLKNYKHRLNVLNELIQTEKAYVKDLSLIINYIKPEVEKIVKRRKQIDSLFLNIQSIFNLNSALSKLLDEIDRKDPKYLFLVGKTLFDHSQLFKLYYSYCEQQSAAQTSYKEHKASIPEFKDLMSSLTKDSKLRGLGWEGIMIKPVQRLPKYELLLKDFLKHTEEDHPAKLLYSEVLESFIQVLQTNNSKISEQVQNLVLFQLQKQYGDPNNYKILDSARKLLKEEKMIILLDNLEVKVLVYFLTDLILICESDEKSETGYKALRFVELNEKSYCQDIKSQDYQNTLCKLVGKKSNALFISETEELNKKLIQEFTDIVGEIVKRSQGKQLQDQFYKIEVQVRGTEERDQNTFSAYTVYVIDIYIENIITKVYLRFSELQKVWDVIRKDHPDIILPRLTQTSWVGNKNAKVIEARKLQIEDMILQLLLNELFQKKDQLAKQKILKMLQLDSNFYQFPDLLNILQDTVGKKSLMIKNDDKISSNLLLKSYSETLNIRQSEIVEINRVSIQRASVYLPNQIVPNFTVIIKLHDESKLEISIPEDSKGYDLVQIISDKIGLDDPFDFRLYECDESMEKQRPIMDDEIISQIYSNQSEIIKFFSKQTIILFRKYLFLPHEDEELQDDLKNKQQRIKLISFQHFYDIQTTQYHFNIDEYIIFASLFILIHISNNPKQKDLTILITSEILGKVLPAAVFKQQNLKSWQQKIIPVISEMEKNLIQFVYFKDDNEQQQEIFDSDQNIILLNTIKNQSIRAGIVLETIITQHPLYGITYFSIQFQLKDLQLLFQYFCVTINEKVPPTPLLGISYNGLHFVDENRKKEYVLVNHYKEFRAFSTQVLLILEGIQITFQTLQGYQMKNLIEEYEFVKSQLE